MRPRYSSLYERQAIYFAVLVALLVLSEAPASAQTVWQKMNGPVDTLHFSRIISLSNSPSNNIYAGVYQGGIFRSTDHGGHWSSASNGYDDSTNGAPLSIIVCNDGSVLASTIWQGLYRSTDSGAHWSLVQQGRFMENYNTSFAIAANGDVLMINDSGLFRSHDNGYSWEYFGNSGRAIAIDDKGDIFSCSYFVIVESTDNGATWIQKAKGLRGTALLCDSNYVFVVMSKNILRSSGIDTVWDTLSIGNKYGIKTLKSSGGYLYAGTDHGVFRSMDWGATWDSVNVGMGDTLISSLAFDSLGHMYAGTNAKGIYRSLDDGQHWANVVDSLPLDHIDLVPCVAVDSNANILAASVASFYDTIIGTSVFRSSDNGASWNKIMKGNSFIQALAVKNRNTIFVATRGSGIYRTTNNGASWQPVNNGLDTLNILSLVIDNNGFVFAGATGYGGVYESTDNGQTWSVADSGLNDNTVSSQSVGALFITEHGAMLASTNNGIYRSVDNGTHWLRTELTASGINMMTMGKSGEIFASVKGINYNGSSYFRSADDGIHWTAYSNLGGSGIDAMSSDGRGYLYAQVHGIGVNRSTDNGQNWYLFNTGIGDSSTIFIKYDQNYIYAGTDSGIYRADSSAAATAQTPIEAWNGGLRVTGMNIVSNIAFSQENFGEIFFNTSVAGGTWGLYWPRGYDYHYIFGGGFWFGDVHNKSRHVLVGYNPYNGGSWFQPGSVDAAEDFYDSTLAATGKGRYPNDSAYNYAKKYAIYSSTLYNKTSGKLLDSALDMLPWPVWDTDPDTNKIVGYDHYFGNYVDSIPLRDTSVYHIRYLTKYIRHVDTIIIGGHDSLAITIDTVVVRKGGPAFVSDEDMFTVCNPVDTTFFLQSSNTSYPALEVQRAIYSWGSGFQQNTLWIVYDLINKSNFTIDSCWFAPVIDADVGNPTNDENGYYYKDPTMNFAMQWSQQEAGVPQAQNQNLAYPGVLGMKYLQTPVIYKEGEIADSLVSTLKPGFYFPDKQIGMTTYDRWEISGAGDPVTDNDRYQFMAGRNKDTSLNQVSDKRALFATGPFKLLAGQSAQISWGLVIARDSANGDNDLAPSMNECVAQARQMQILYDNSFNPVGQTTSVEQRRDMTANTWSLDAYPNPLANTAHLSFTLSQASHVTVILYDMIGREVKRLTEKQLFGAGSHTLTFDVAALPSGVYMCVLSTTSETMQKMVSLTR